MDLLFQVDEFSIYKDGDIISIIDSTNSVRFSAFTDIFDEFCTKYISKRSSMELGISIKD